MNKIFVYLALFLPLIYLLVRVFLIEDINDPIKYIYTITGVSSTVILLFSITISMIKRVKLMKYRKVVGVFGFFYAFLHLLNFIIFDAQFDMGFIFEETIEKPFIYLGMIAFFILLFMFFTSTKKLYKKFKNFHKFVYLALIFITIHWIMAQKSITGYQTVYLTVTLFIGYYKLKQQIIKNSCIINS